MRKLIKPKNVRSEDDIRQMIRAIEMAVEETPAEDCWGNSNARDIREMQQEVRELKKFLRKGECEDWSEARLWLEDNKGAVLQKDFEEYLKKV
jgi:hypothetical protein